MEKGGAGHLQVFLDRPDSSVAMLAVYKSKLGLLERQNAHREAEGYPEHYPGFKFNPGFKSPQP